MVIPALAVCMALYHMISPFYLFVGPNGHQMIHLTFALVLIFLQLMKQAKVRWLGMLLASVYIALTLFSSIYTLSRIAWLEELAGDPDLPFEVVLIGLFLVFLVLEATRETLGIVIPVVSVIFMTYAYFGEYIPGFLHGAPVGFNRFFIRLGVGNLGQNGIFGPVLSISANVVFLFFVYGALLQATGALRFFTEIGKWAGRKLAGGPAISAVVSSALIGMITGTPVGNVALTGSFTIPAMKRYGYQPYQAGAIEAAASTGGALMPPVMGLVAFLMAAMTGIPYFKIALMALIPALLYFFSVFLYVQFQAMKQRELGLVKPAMEEKVNMVEITAGAPLFILPLILLVYLIVRRYSLGYAIAWTNLFLLGLSLLRKKTRPDLRELVEEITKGANAGSSIAAACGAIGLILGAASLTVLVQKIPIVLVSLAGGSLIVALILTAFSSIILGMGVSVVVAYLVVAMVTAPVLIRLGLTVDQAHLYVLYFATMGFVTPPVAAASLVAAKLADAPFIQTALEATKVAMAGFIVPILFIYAPVLIMQPQAGPGVESLRVITTIILLISLQAGLCRHYFLTLRRLEVLIFLLIAAGLFMSFPLDNMVLAVVGIVAFVLATLWQWKKKCGGQIFTLDFERR